MAAPSPLLSALMLVVLATAALAAAGGVNKRSGSSRKAKDLNNKVDIKLYTRLYSENGQKLDAYNDTFLEKSKFNPLVPTKILVHGWLSGETKSKGGAILKDALLEISDYNVILVDWSQADSINYLGSRWLVSTLGELIGDLIGQLYMSGGIDFSDLHLIGHSLGAHAMGFAGRTAGLGKHGRITALDPAGPLFWNDPAVRLDKSDAGFVDVIHTCAPVLGYWDPIGHVDFYPNGGTWVQPGCGLDAGTCSHCRGYSLLLESMETPGAFVGTSCTGWDDYKAGVCAGNATAELGLGLDRRARGSFYFETNAEPPYSKLPGATASARLNSTKNFGRLSNAALHALNIPPAAGMYLISLTLIVWVSG
ncbi:lipase member H-B isoform X2 [Frankliniella occidentalis]|uniref:Lipase member H-B isoform X2 n=1 Tax=Frankliniella occidentalis TaxID=133901 RepID=A0A9C6TXK7_FRAOC|nr:lipase member H-B isoform X2 [Frankliniella occidentalis]